MQTSRQPAERARHPRHTPAAPRLLCVTIWEARGGGWVCPELGPNAPVLSPTSARRRGLRDTVGLSSGPDRSGAVGHGPSLCLQLLSNCGEAEDAEPRRAGTELGVWAPPGGTCRRCPLPHVAAPCGCGCSPSSFAVSPPGPSGAELTEDALSVQSQRT